MSKTAEEILRDKPLHDFDQLMYTEKESLSAMREFAAQEVEAYKERLKEFIEEQYFSNSSIESFSLFHIQQLIDTVK